jgi:hypothetical protein
MIILVDIDNNIIKSSYTKCEHCGLNNYKLDSVCVEDVNKINELYDKGNTIIMFTGRNWNQYNVTKKTLSEIKIKYHELVMGKPAGVYFDKDAVKDINEVINE